MTVSICDIPPAPELKNAQTDFCACDRETSAVSPNAYFGGRGMIQKVQVLGRAAL